MIFESQAVQKLGNPVFAFTSEYDGFIPYFFDQGGAGN